MKAKKHVKKRPPDNKTVIRRSKEWTALRMRVKKKQKYDPVTGSPLAKGFNLHHLDVRAENYDNISDETRFVGLNSTTHTIIHAIWGDGNRRYDWRERLERIKKICELMDILNDD